MSKSKADLPAVPIHVLVIDDDETHAETVAENLERIQQINCQCTVATSGARGAALIESENYDVVVTDLQMDDIDGLGILQKTKQELPDAEVIVLTGHGSINSAVTAMQHGAYTYLTKPLDIQELRSAVLKASSRLQLIRQNAELNRRLDEKFGFEGVIGNSPQMHRIIQQLKQVAPTDADVLITGENGTGKELVAKAVHQNSPRKNKPFVALNIAALPESTLEDELFGHEPGAFTNATTRRIGKFEHANGGTLFLDEIGDMPLDTQVKLLRVLSERKITRLGSNDEIAINVRIVAATNADLKKAIEEKKFRQDLYYRLQLVEIRLPPLRDRRGDIPLLLDAFRNEACERYHKEVQNFTRAAQQALMACDWPGNIRQLKHVVERAVILDLDGILDVDDLPDEIASKAPEPHEPVPGGDHPGSDAMVGRPIADVEKYYIQRALELTQGNRKQAAEMLDIPERTFYRTLDKYGLK